MRLCQLRYIMHYIHLIGRPLDVQRTKWLNETNRVGSIVVIIIFIIITIIVTFAVFVSALLSVRVRV